MEFIVDKDVVDLGVVVRGVEIIGTDNSYYPDSLRLYIKEHVEEILKEEYKQNNIIDGFYTLHNKVHVSKRKNIPASENLLKLLNKNQSLYSINPAADIYNLVSMETKLALGAHDIDFIGGNMYLRLTNGNEKFIPLGQNESKEFKEGVYSYIDDSNDILCYLEVRQVDKTKITEDSENIFYIIQGNENTSQEYVDSVAKHLIYITTHFLGGEGRLLNNRK